MIEGRRNEIGTALVGLAVVLFVVPAIVPVQPVLYHDTRETTHRLPSELDDGPVRVVAYENLSDRGQQLYRRTLENNGEYRVSRNRGASEFEYPTDEERAAAFENGSRRQTGYVVIERPEDDRTLPQSDERFFRGRFEERRDEEGEGERELNESEVDRLRQQVLRYDAMETRTAPPPLNAPAQLLRLGAVLFAVLFLGAGGYLLSLPSRE